MSRKLSVLTVAPVEARDAVIKGLTQILEEKGQSVSLFRYLTNERTLQLGEGMPTGATYKAFLSDPDAKMTEIVEKFRQLDSDAIISAGSDYAFIGGWDEFGTNLDIAVNTGSPVLLVLSNRHGCPCQGVRTALATAQAHHATVAGVLVVDAGNPERKASHLKEELAHLNLSIAAVNELSADTAAQTLREAFGDQLDALLDTQVSGVVTPLQFQLDLVERARQHKRTIVLPEPEDDRVLQAADRLLALDVANLILIGDEEAVRARAAELELNIDAAKVISNHDPELVEKYAAEFAKLRAKKGVTLEQAREKVQDVSFFGTMMVYFGDADGMVSGAAHTTAHTIVPSFQTIKTKPGTSIVSSVFLMLMPDQVHVYGDCAVNPNPTPEQLADIAISSAETAVAFGVDPKIAMISYSSGNSGSGPDVDAVKEATAILQEKAPELVADGPLQFDAAYDPHTGASKMPGSPVAGQANVYIFPSLSVGNALYKAVQRTSGATAVGPILQGLKRPVNDLSRGALVEDIVNTVVITAVQAQSVEGGSLAK
ncbi:phosphate acetyltransferase [Boudabousia marimammalium]|uniref:Phosphate acetyltransferase n=1 Tax=Boudabousia marimammalium TaxID=156892 RepID=A0A1Q5PS37_9ACTO|nr:phosphate acetyltransferase [Boudabousia marimammalium]OKL50319.1 phosphate acetyltransferase [Boudabousia marimammalium]